jgi:IS5 family transposase
MQQRYSLSDPAMEDALIVVLTMRRFAVIDLISERIPNQNTNHSFHHLLEKINAGKKIRSLWPPENAPPVHAQKKLSTRSGVVTLAALITPERHRTERSDRRTNGVI